MKSQVKKHALVEALKLVLPATNAKATLPVLSNVHLRAEGNLLTIQGTNLTVGITANVLADVEQQGEITVSARSLSDLVATATGDTVSLEIDGTRLVVKWEKSRTKLSTIPAEEFPPMPAFRYEGTELKVETLKKAIQRVAISASTDEARPVLQSIQVLNHSMVATDGFRLSVYQLTDVEIPAALIPAEALKLVARMAKDECLAVRTEPGRIIFTGTGWQLVSQLTDGNFPDYRIIIPKKTNTTVTMPVSALKAALAQMKVIGGPYVLLEASEARCALSVKSDETGEAETELDAVVNGPASEIAFNPSYFSDTISILNGSVTLKIIDHKSPCVVTDEDQAFMHVIMPVHKG